MHISESKTKHWSLPAKQYTPFLLTHVNWYTPFRFYKHFVNSSSLKNYYRQTLVLFMTSKATGRLLCITTTGWIYLGNFGLSKGVAIVYGQDGG